jgi:hypothetical protein
VAAWRRYLLPASGQFSMTADNQASMRAGYRTTVIGGVMVERLDDRDLWEPAIGHAVIDLA